MDACAAVSAATPRRAPGKALIPSAGRYGSARRRRHRAATIPTRPLRMSCSTPKCRPRSPSAASSSGVCTAWASGGTGSSACSYACSAGPANASSARAGGTSSAGGCTTGSTRPGGGCGGCRCGGGGTGGGDAIGDRLLTLPRGFRPRARQSFDRVGRPNRPPAPPHRFPTAGRLCDAWPVFDSCPGPAAGLPRPTARRRYQNG